MGRLARPGGQDHAAQDRLPDELRDLDDARIGEELASDSARTAPGSGAFGRAEIDQQDADLRLIGVTAPITIGRRARTRWPVSEK